MFWNQARMVVVLLVAAGLVGGMAALGQSRLTEQPTEVKKEEAAPPPQESFKEYIARVRGWRAQDSDSDTDEASFPRFDDRWYLSALASARLPPKVMATMQARHDAAAVELDGRWKEFLAGRGMLDLLFGACERMLRSEAEVDKKREHQVRVLEGHLKRMQEILKVNKDRYEAGRIPVQDVAESEFYYQDAKLRLEQARENP